MSRRHPHAKNAFWALLGLTTNPSSYGGELPVGRGLLLSAGLAGNSAAKEGEAGQEEPRSGSQSVRRDSAGLGSSVTETGAEAQSDGDVSRNPVDPVLMPDGAMREKADGKSLPVDSAENSVKRTTAESDSDPGPVAGQEDDPQARESAGSGEEEPGESALDHAGAARQSIDASSVGQVTEDVDEKELASAAVHEEAPNGVSGEQQAQGQQDEGGSVEEVVDEQGEAVGDDETGEEELEGTNEDGREQQQQQKEVEAEDQRGDGPRQVDDQQVEMTGEEEAAVGSTSNVEKAMDDQGGEDESTERQGDAHAGQREVWQQAAQPGNQGEDEEDPEDEESEAQLRQRHRESIRAMRRPWEGGGNVADSPSGRLSAGAGLGKARLKELIEAQQRGGLVASPAEKARRRHAEPAVKQKFRLVSSNSLSQAHASSSSNSARHGSASLRGGPPPSGSDGSRGHSSPAGAFKQPSHRAGKRPVGYLYQVRPGCITPVSAANASFPSCILSFCSRGQCVCLQRDVRQRSLAEYPCIRLTSEALRPPG